jgi:hypothetical protein
VVIGACMQVHDLLVLLLIHLQLWCTVRGTYLPLYSLLSLSPFLFLILLFLVHLLVALVVTVTIMVTVM